MLETKATEHLVACIKQPPTSIDWPLQQRSGAVHPAARYLPIAAIAQRSES